MSSRLDQLYEFLKESPQDPFLHYAIATEHWKAGDLMQAKAGFERLVRDFPEYQGTYYHLGKLYVELGQPDEAIRTYRMGIDLARRTGKHHAMGELQGALADLVDDDDDDMYD